MSLHPVVPALSNPGSPLTGTYRAVLTGLKYVIERSSLLQGGGRNTEKYYESKPSDFALRTKGRGYNFRDDYYSLGCIMYRCCVREDLVTDHYPFQPNWPHEPLGSYRAIQLKHLTQVLLASCHFSHLIPLSDFLHHPYFMEVSEMVAFESRMRSFTCPRHNRSIDRDLEAGKSHVYVGDWLNRIEDPAISSFIQRKRANSQDWNFMDFWVIRNNRRRHRFEDPLFFREVIGFMNHSDFEYWETRFPYCFLYLFLVVMSHRPTTESSPWFLHPELVDSFPASKPFYVLCMSTPIREDLVMPCTDISGIL